MSAAYLFNLFSKAPYLLCFNEFPKPNLTAPALSHGLLYATPYWKSWFRCQRSISNLTQPKQNSWHSLPVLLLPQSCLSQDMSLLYMRCSGHFSHLSCPTHDNLVSTSETWHFLFPLVATASPSDFKVSPQMPYTYWPLPSESYYCISLFYFLDRTFHSILLVPIPLKKDILMGSNFYPFAISLSSLRTGPVHNTLCCLLLPGSFLPQRAVALTGSLWVGWPTMNQSFFRSHLKCHFLSGTFPNNHSNAFFLLISGCFFHMIHRHVKSSHRKHTNKQV